MRSLKAASGRAERSDSSDEGEGLAGWSTERLVHAVENVELQITDAGAQVTLAREDAGGEPPVSRRVQWELG